jgi:uncharacterized Zn finger protein
LQCSQDCGNVVIVHPDWRLGCCFECGAVYERVLMPAQRAEVEALLIPRRHPSLRGWKATEPLEQLERENAHLSARGLIVQERR